MRICDDPDRLNSTTEALPEILGQAVPSYVSPSLRPKSDEPAFEMKFLLAGDLGTQVLGWAREHLHVDPHADPQRDHTYEVQTLYFDTPEFDVYRKADKYKRRKYRLRRYGSGSPIFLEEKKKVGEQVAKRRTQVDESTLLRLQQTTLEPEWEGHWFHRRLQKRRLLPTCQIAYERHAFFGESADGPLRLTLDRQLRGQRVEGWQFGAMPGAVLLENELLLELKYRAYLPAVFKRMLQDFGILSRSLSKYRLAFSTCGFELPEGFRHG